MVARSFRVSSDERATGIVEAFRLIHDVQAGLPSARDGLARLRERARKEGWDDLERVCMFGDAVSSWMSGDGQAAGSVAALIESATGAGDHVMLALGLALGSDQGFAGTDLFGTAAFDADLARAIVLLEEESGRPCERISAHTACAIALQNRWLFELSDEQYELALSIGRAEPPGTVDFLLAPILFNRAEQHVSWATKLHELGDRQGVQERWQAWKQLLTATEEYPMPESWHLELAALGLILQAIAGEQSGAEAARLAALAEERADLETRAVGLLRLPLALELAEGELDSGSGKEAAARAIDAALAAISPGVHPFLYDLALFTAARLEARSGASAGLRYARRALEAEWTKREASLRAMRGQMASVRLTSERDLLSRHARLDDLTGIANRRSLEEFLSGLLAEGSESCAVVLFDVDAFKAVNDKHGHLAGDQLLVRIAEVLARSVRASDLAVRLGGDEFAIVLAEVDITSARQRAEALFAALTEEPLDDIAGGIELQVSVGVAVGSPHSITPVWSAADAALYEAKALGGQQVCLAPPVAPSS